MKILNFDGLKEVVNNIKAGFTPVTRKINGKTLDADITLSAEDVGADASGYAASALTLAKEHTDTSINTLSNEINTKLATKSDTSHTHDDRYYTESEIDSKLAEKADASHNHNTAYDAKGDAEKAKVAANTYTDENIEALNEGFSDVIYQMYGDDITEEGAPTIRAIASDEASKVQSNLDAVSDNLTAHIDNSDIHFTATERTKLAGIATGANKYSHPSSGVTAGTYRSVTVDANGHVTKGTNPTTLSEYGITDAASKSTVATLQQNFDEHVDDTELHFTTADRTKFSGIESGAQKNTLTGVKGSAESTYRTGNVNITAANIGLGNVNNTSDANKPVSTAQQAAIDAAKTAANTYTDGKVANLASTTVVDNKISSHNTSTSAHSDIRSLISDLSTKLNNFLDVDDATTDQLSEVLTMINSNKETLESITTSKINVSDIVDNLTTSSASKVLSAKQGVAIKSLIDTLQASLDELEETLSGKANSGHTHDDRYYTETEVDSLLSGKANTSHGNHVPTTETANNAKFLRNDNTWQTVTPANIGAAAASHGTHVSYSSTAPVMDGTASAGSASTVARSDHKHPTDTTRVAQTTFDSHKDDSTHITSTERTNWNAAKTHADSAHAPSNAQPNQNAFSNIKVGSTTVAADTTTDTVTFVGSNVTITPDATNDEITFAVADGSTSAKGLVQLTNSTSSTSTTTAATPSSVKSAYDLANTAKTAAQTAQSTADSKADSNHNHDSAYAPKTHAHNNASTTANGFMSLEDKTKLNYTNIAYGTCATDAATAAKVVTISGNTNWTLTNGSLITVFFSATNTAENPTLNVNGTGAKNIYYGASQITTSSLGYGGTANRVMNFMYDGTQYRFIGWGYDSNTTYTNVKLGHGYATCSTAAATVAKVATLSSYTLTTGGIVAVKFTNAVPANATLNINSKGAKNIYFRGAKITADVIKAGDVATFIYSSNYHLISIDRWQNDISSLQTQIDAVDNAKSDVGHTHTVANITDLTATATELNYMDGVTSNVQAQLNGKAASSHGTHVSYGTSATAVGATAGAGSATTVSRSDHTHSLSKAAVTTALGYTPPTKDTTYGVATSSALGLVKSGTDISVDSSGNVTVVDNSHKHTVSNISDITATAAELNKLDGVTATTAEINCLDGITSGIQAQLDSKAANGHTHSYNISNIASTNAPWENINGDSAEDLFIDIDEQISTLKSGKANSSTLTSHTGNTTVHITASERTAWNAKANADHTHDASAINVDPLNNHNCSNVQTALENFETDITNLQSNINTLSNEIVYAGNDGNISIADESAEIINQIPISTDDSGAIYNGTGYKNGVRWSSSSQAESANDDYGMTGYIPCKHNDTIRIKDVVPSTSSSGYIVLFDSSKAYLGVQTVSLHTMSVDSNNAYTVSISGNANVEFIRLSVCTFTSASIVTVNQDFSLTGNAQIGWLLDSDNTKIAPRTLSSMVIRPDGTNIEDYINDSNASTLDISKEYTEEQIVANKTTVDSSLSLSSNNPVENQAVTNWLADNVKKYRLVFNEDYENSEIYACLSDVNTDAIADLPADEGDGYVINYLESYSGDIARFGVKWENITDIPSASTSTTGVVQLTNSTSSTSTTTAATPSSVKTAYDLANTAKTAAATAQSTADSKTIVKIARWS